MTNAEAIEHLKNIIIFSYQDGYTAEAREALDMAVKALEAQKRAPMNDDLISRAEAIKAVEKSRQLNHHTDKKAISAHEHEHRHFMRILTALPPAQPEHKKGQWINIRHDNVAECSRCGVTGRAWMNFCFDCGADMRGEKNDDES